MALSDRFLQRSNQSPSSYKEYLMTTDNPSSEGYARFLERSSGNLNRAELDLLQEDDTGSMRMMQEMLTRFMESGNPQIQKMIGSLLSAGAPIRDVLEQVQRFLQEGDVGGRIAAGAPMSRFNQGGIVSLRRLTRPLGY